MNTNITNDTVKDKDTDKDNDDDTNKNEIDIETNIIKNNNDNNINNQLRYVLFKGKNLFLCNGMFMLGKPSYHLLLSLSLITFTWIAYTVCILPFLQSPILFKTAWTIASINLILLISTSFTDAGIIPRTNVDTNMILPLSIQAKLKTKYSYCNICKIWRPIRSKHCRHCDNCVDSFDHHCPWTGNCVGARNYLIFFLFVSSVLLGAIFILTSSLLLLVGWITNVKCNAPILRAIVTIGMLIWSTTCLILVGALFLFHIFLIKKGQTTCEYLRKIPAPQRLPQTLVGKVLASLCYIPCCYQQESTCCLVQPTNLLPMYHYRNELDDEIELERLNKYIQSVY